MKVDVTSSLFVCLRRFLQCCAVMQRWTSSLLVISVTRPRLRLMNRGKISKAPYENVIRSAPALRCR